MRKRGNGEGTLYQRKDGSWCAQASINGKRVTSYGKTKTEARTKLRKKLDSLAVNGGENLQRSRMTIKQAIEVLRSQQNSTNARTETCYKERLEIVNRYIGRELLRNLNTDMLEFLINNMINDGYSRNTIKLVIAQVKRVFNFAKKNNYIERGKYLGKLNINKKTPKFILPKLDDVVQVIQEIKSVPLKYLAMFGIYTGLRRGELCGLQWGDISDDGVISVMREYVGYKRNNCELSPPKNGIVGQKVQTPQEGMLLLEELKMYYKENNIKSDFVFCKKNGEPLLPKTVSTELGRRIKKIAPRGAVHILRHLNATFLASQNIPIRTISMQLRHSSVSITDRYINELVGESRDNIKNLKLGCSKVAVEQKQT